eukprot:UN32635
MNTSRGRGARNSRVPSAKAQIAMLKSSLHGHVNNLKATNPPPFNRKPYNTITVEEVFTGTTTEQTVTIAGIGSALQTQLEFHNNSLPYKIQRIDLWVIPSPAGEVPSIRGQFFSLVSNTSHGTSRTAPYGA